jgi:hypothetical protein
MKALPLGWQLVLTFASSLIVLVCLIGWLHNVHIYTSNGMYKSIQAEPWISDFAHARLDQSNYLYFPLYGALARLLDAVGILPGVAWKQFAYLNAFWASLGVVVVYAFVWRATGSTIAAVLASLFHFGTGFFLLLGTINEDIMPGYVLVLASMALAGLWFDRPTYRRIIVVAAVFTLGWLVEWRLIFPTLPALVLALLIAEGSWKSRTKWVATLLVSIVAVAGIVQQIWEGHNGAVGLHDLLWTGKGVETGWAGFDWDKAWMMLSGVGSYFLMIGGYESSLAAQQKADTLAISALLQAAVLAVCVAVLWSRRHEPRLRAIAVVFLGTLGAGQVMNIYSQPQDPQMQINVMPWLTVAWALLVASWLAVRPRALAVLAVLSLAPLVWNVAYLARQRGGDAVSLATLADLERRFPADSTVFVYWGFEPMTMWQYATWSHTWDWDDKPPALAAAPATTPKFKWIAVDAGAVRHPQWTAEQDGQSLKRDIELAFERGYRVVASDVWEWSVEELTSQLGGLSAANRAQAIYATLHGAYEGTLVVHTPKDGNYYELKRRSGP